LDQKKSPGALLLLTSFGLIDRRGGAALCAVRREIPVAARLAARLSCDPTWPGSGPAIQAKTPCNRAPRLGVRDKPLGKHVSTSQRIKQPESRLRPIPGVPESRTKMPQDLNERKSACRYIATFSNAIGLLLKADGIAHFRPRSTPQKRGSLRLNIASFRGFNLR
jgi:hypothetical protein